MIYYSGKKTGAIEIILLLDIEKLVKWCGETGYKLSSTRTVTMRICCKRSYPGCLETAQQLTLHEEAIICEDKHIYLEPWSPRFNCRLQACMGDSL